MGTLEGAGRGFRLLLLNGSGWAGVGEADRFLGLRGWGDPRDIWAGGRGDPPKSCPHQILDIKFCKAPLRAPTPATNFRH